MAISGMDLKVERIRARVTMVDLAARLGTTRATLWVLEKSADVSTEQAERYRSALNGERDVETQSA